MARSRDPRELVDAAVAGDRAAVARLLSLVERGGQPAREVGALTHPRGGRAYTVGITGAPGAGKSTLTNRVIEQVRADGLDVGVLAIDPSSPFTGGAILGDRVRMQDHALDGGVFIRSMATRGHLAGVGTAPLDQRQQPGQRGTIAAAGRVEELSGMAATHRQANRS